MASMSIAAYALLCLVLPQIWALLVARAYRSWDSRAARLRRADPTPPEYMI